MNLKVVYYGQARDVAETERDIVDVVDESSLTDVVLKVTKSHGAPLERLLLTPEGTLRGSVLISVNDDVVEAGSQTRLRDGDEIAVFTAVAGG